MVQKNLFWNPSLQEDCYFCYWIWDFGHFYEVRESSLPHGGISKIFFLGHFSPSFLGQNCIFGYKFHFEGKNDLWISQVRHVKRKLEFDVRSGEKLCISLILPSLLFCNFPIYCLANFLSRLIRKYILPMMLFSDVGSYLNLGGHNLPPPPLLLR